MEYISCSDPRVWGGSDAQTIQNAIALAKQEGCDQVVIPRMNARTGEAVWHIDENIVLLSSMTVILSGAYLRAADDLPVHVFCTELSQTELHDIRILGVGEATIDGGAWTRENRPEYYHEQSPEEYPDGCDYDLISLFNVRNFEVANLCITNTHCILTLSGVTLKNEDANGYLLRVAGNSAARRAATAHRSSSPPTPRPWTATSSSTPSRRSA